MNIKMNPQCRIAPSLGGGFAGHPNDVWGTVNYSDKNKPCVFFGLYDLRDYIALWKHKGKAWILWCGGDLANLDTGFILNNGKLRWISRIPFMKWLIVKLISKAENWVENEWEASILIKYDIPYKICQSFLGNIKKYKISYKKNGHYWMSANRGRQKEYGWNFIEEIASTFPEKTFHFYGAKWKTEHKNIIVHGRVSQKQMDKEVKKMEGSIRLNEKDGFSEVTAKALLWGQYPVTTIKYPFTNLVSKKTPNKKGRNYYLKHLNNFPWSKSYLEECST